MTKKRFGGDAAPEFSHRYFIHLAHPQPLVYLRFKRTPFPGLSETHVLLTGVLLILTYLLPRLFRLHLRHRPKTSLIS